MASSLLKKWSKPPGAALRLRPVKHKAFEQQDLAVSPSEGELGIGASVVILILPMIAVRTSGGEIGFSWRIFVGKMEFFVVVASSRHPKLSVVDCYCGG